MKKLRLKNILKLLNQLKRKNKANNGSRNRRKNTSNT